MLIEKGLYENLYWWGYYALLSDICYRILKPNVSKKLKIVLHVILGKIQRNLGNLNEAQKTYESVLADLDDSIEPNCKIRLFYRFGRYQQLPEQRRRFPPLSSEGRPAS